MGEHWIPGREDSQRRPEQKDHENAYTPQTAIAMLRRLLQGLQRGGPKASDQIKEIRKLFFSIHPDKNPGTNPVEKAAFGRLATIASSVLDWYRQTEPFEYKDMRDMGWKLDELTTIEESLKPKPAPEPPRSTVGSGTGAGARTAGTGNAWGGESSRSWWESETEDEEDATETEEKPEKPPYETEELDFGPAFIGKRMYEVKIDVDEDVMDRTFNDEDRYFGRQRPDRYFEIEGIDGVVAAYISITDEYRDNFGGWKIVKGLKGTRIRELGTIRSFEGYSKEDQSESSLGGYDRGTRVQLSAGEVRFGTSAYDAYYPHGYCRVK